MQATKLRMKMNAAILALFVATAGSAMAEREAGGRVQWVGVKVDFASIGTGIDGVLLKDVQQRIGALVVDGSATAYKKMTWGREGEATLCVEIVNPDIRLAFFQTLDQSIAASDKPVKAVVVKDCNSSGWPSEHPQKTKTWECSGGTQPEGGAVVVYLTFTNGLPVAAAVLETLPNITSKGTKLNSCVEDTDNAGKFVCRNPEIADGGVLAILSHTEGGDIWTATVHHATRGADVTVAENLQCKPIMVRKFP